MKVTAFNGSPRRSGNTSILIGHVFEVLEQEGIETELVQVGGERIRGCAACLKCRENPNGKCVFDDDILNGCVEKMAGSDGIILGSPVYVSNVTSEMKALIDRAVYVAIANGGLFRRKVGAAVTAVRRAGALPAFDAMNHFFLIMQMIVPGSSYWNLGIGRNIGEVEADEEGLRTMRVLGENMAWLLKKVNG